MTMNIIIWGTIFTIFIHSLFIIKFWNENERTHTHTHSATFHYELFRPSIEYRTTPKWKSKEKKKISFIRHNYPLVYCAEQFINSLHNMRSVPMLCSAMLPSLCVLCAVIIFLSFLFWFQVKAQILFVYTYSILYEFYSLVVELMNQYTQKKIVDVMFIVQRYSTTTTTTTSRTNGFFSLEKNENCPEWSERKDWMFKTQLKVNCFSVTWLIIFQLLVQW